LGDCNSDYSDSESDGSTTEDSEDSEDSDSEESEAMGDPATGCHSHPAPVGREAPRRLETSGPVEPWNGCCRHQDGCPTPAKCLVSYMISADLPSPLIASRLMQCILLHWFARVRLPGAKMPPLDGSPARSGDRMSREITPFPPSSKPDSPELIQNILVSSQLRAQRCQIARLSRQRPLAMLN
jgi:hypothetical protein